MRLLTNANQSALGAASAAHARKRLARRPLETTARHTPGHKLGKQPILSSKVNTNSVSGISHRRRHPQQRGQGAGGGQLRCAVPLEACCTGGPLSDPTFAPSCCVTSPWACRCSF